MIRRVSTAAGLWGSAALGFLATVVAARGLSTPDFGRYGIVMGVVAFVQTLLDLTAEEAAIKYGFRYIAQERWGKLRRLLEGTLLFKVAGGALAAVVLVAVAPLADRLWHGDTHMEVPLLLGAAIPLAQAPEGLAGVALYLRGRYDIRSFFLAVSMALRLAAVAVGVQFGLVETFVALALAQVAATAAVSVAGWLAFRRFPRVAAEPLGAERRDIFRFVLQSIAATGIISLRSTVTVPLLGAVTSLSQAAYYRVAQAPQTGFAMLSAPARMVLLTEQTRDWEHGSRRQVIRGVRRYSAGAAALMVVIVPLLLWLMPDIVRILFHARNLPAVNAARLIVVAGALQFVVGWSKSLPVAVGRPNLRIWTHGLEVLVLLPLTAVFGVEWGATGGGAAMAASSAVFAVVWAWLFLRISHDVHATPEPDARDVVEPPAEAVTP
jgi:O-antigen/teichoic acid export membrane protein